MAKVIHSLSGVLPARSAPRSLTESMDSASFPGTNLTRNPLLMEQSPLTTDCTQPVAKVIHSLSGVLPARSAPGSLTESMDSASFPGTNLTKNPLLMEQSPLTTDC